MRPAAELLLIESGTLPAILDRADDDGFDRPTACEGWSVRDVLAHCGAAMGHLVAGDRLVFTPEANQVDVDARRAWPLARVIDELVSGYREAAVIIDRLGGPADGLGLGEWMHGGDVRQPLGEPDAYASPGVELAIPLLVERSRSAGAVAVRAVVDGEVLAFGGDVPEGELVTDTATFVRLCGARNPDPSSYTLAGVEPEALVLFS